MFRDSILDGRAARQKQVCPAAQSWRLGCFLLPRWKTGCKTDPCGRALSGGAWDVLLRCCLLLSEIFEATASLKQAELTLSWASKVLEKRFCAAPFRQDTTSLWMFLSGRDCSAAERAVSSCENKACDPRETPSLESDAIFPTPEVRIMLTFCRKKPFLTTCRCGSGGPFTVFGWLRSQAAKKP